MDDQREQGPRAGPRKKREFIRLLGVASTVGINLVLSTVIGFSIGYFLLDTYVFGELLSLHTFPWFTLLFLILGIAAGFKYLFSVAKRASLDNDVHVRKDRD